MEFLEEGVSLSSLAFSVQNVMEVAAVSSGEVVNDDLVPLNREKDTESK